MIKMLNFDLSIKSLNVIMVSIWNMLLFLKEIFKKWNKNLMRFKKIFVYCKVSVMRYFKFLKKRNLSMESWSKRFWLRLISL